MRLELKPQKSIFGPEDTHRTVQVDQLVLNKGVSGATYWGWDKRACQPCPSLFSPLLLLLLLLFLEPAAERGSAIGRGK